MIFRSLKEDVACLHSEMTNFGSSFKRARETKGISIDQIASETRISTRFLLAIENEQFHLLPGGIFNRGFIRAYAEKVGLDPAKIREWRPPGPRNVTGVCIRPQLAACFS
ncbi:MAG: hypothetical protein AUI91_01825 [Acidobacteria bacterium 13_1_40CM_3_56_11]|nr:MAG: hypothetical protein AUI91_01825 [Acidobacteria bacterium 13_1_40CM_3_56_11]